MTEKDDLKKAKLTQLVESIKDVVSEIRDPNLRREAEGFVLKLEEAQGVFGDKEQMKERSKEIKDLSKGDRSLLMRVRGLIKPVREFVYQYEDAISPRWGKGGSVREYDDQIKSRESMIRANREKAKKETRDR